MRVMFLPPEIADEIQRKLEQAKRLYPSALSADHKAVMVDGSIGYGCFVSPEGDVYMETYEIL